MILAIPLSSRMAMKVTFLPTAEVSENIRNLVVGVAIGIMKSKDIKSNSQNWISRSRPKRPIISVFLIPLQMWRQ